MTTDLIDHDQVVFSSISNLLGVNIQHSYNKYIPLSLTIAVERHGQEVKLAHPKK